MSKITVSPEAQDYLRGIIQKQKMEGLAIRLSVTNPGTPGVESGIVYCPKEYITNQDMHFKMDGFEIVIDSEYVVLFDDVVIDLTVDEVGDDLLTMHAPNLKKKLIDENASLKDQIAYYIERFISPSLAGHGGAVRLVDFQDGVVSVEFSGGCNGCSLASATLHEGIERQLHAAFRDQITEVVDATSHKPSESSYA